MPTQMPIMVMLVSNELMARSCCLSMPTDPCDNLSEWAKNQGKCNTEDIFRKRQEVIHSLLLARGLAAVYDVQRRGE